MEAQNFGYPENLSPFIGVSIDSFYGQSNEVSETITLLLSMNPIEDLLRWHTHFSWAFRSSEDIDRPLDQTNIFC